MVVSARALALTLAAFALATRAHIPSHDNILRIQLWDAEGLTREVRQPATESTTTQVAKHHNTKVNLDTLYKEMLDEIGVDFGRFTRHKVRHKRRRTRQSGTELPWRFHEGSQLVNVVEYNYDVPWDVIEGKDSAVSESESVNRTLDAAPPMKLQQLDYEEQDEEEVKKQLPVVPKCCPIAQNLTKVVDEEGNPKWVCARTTLTFAPEFFQANETHIFNYDSNVYETIVGNPCKYERYRLDPLKDSRDEYYLLVNGSLFVPFSSPYLLGTRDYCMETFWNESDPAGITLPLICFQTSEDVTKSSTTLILYATGLLISVPFLLATVCVYTFIRELRDTHGKALACHCMCLAVAFSCLAVTQLAGHAFPPTACTIIAYIIQFSFVSCFFWLNVMCFDIFLNVSMSIVGACYLYMRRRHSPLLRIPGTIFSFFNWRYISTSVSRRSMRRRFAWYCAYAMILPLILLIVTITMQLHPAVPSTYLKPNFGVQACWFQTDQAALPYFYGPVAAILLLNLVIFFLTSRAFAVHYDKLKDVTPLDVAHSEYSTSDDWVRLGTVLGSPIPVQEQRSTSPQQQVNFNQRLKKYKKIFRTSCMLSFIMGLSWVLEVVSWAAGAGTEAVSVWSVFDLINALQGVVIFAIFVLQQPIRTYVTNSRLFSSCRRKTDGSEAAVVSERNSIDSGIGINGRRVFV